MIDVFISHAWRFHPEWVKVSNLIEANFQTRVRNFSLPWHDPAISPSSEYGRGFLTQQLFSQIQPVFYVLFLESLFSAESNHRWLRIEYDIAKQLKKKVAILGNGSLSRQVLDVGSNPVDLVPESDFEVYLTKAGEGDSKA